MPLPRRIADRVREVLVLLQTGHGRSIHRFIWQWLLGPLVFIQVVYTLMYLFWGVCAAGGTIGQALTRLPPSLVLLLVVLWVLVFIRLRPRGEHPDTMVALTRFWLDFDRVGVTVNDVTHEGFAWGVTAGRGANPAGAISAAAYPGLLVDAAPRCPRCGFEVKESQLEPGLYCRACSACSQRRLSRCTLEQSAAEIRRIAEQAWRLLHPARAGR